MTIQGTRSASPVMPVKIHRALARVARRIKGTAATRGIGTTLLLASIASVAGMAADFTFPLPIGARIGIWLAWVALIGLMIVFAVFRPLMRKLDWFELASVAERDDPALGERLTGSVALLDRGQGSPAMISALVAEAADQVDGYRPISRGKSAGSRLAMGLIAVGLVVAPALARPDPFATLGLRFLAPWMDLDRVGQFRLAVTPGDKVAAIGSDFKVEARVEPRFGSKPPSDGAWVEWTEESGATRRVRMTDGPTSTGPARSFVAIVPKLGGSIRYRVGTESTRSRLYRVTAVEPPSIASIHVRVEPPAYTKLPASEFKGSNRIDAVEGSRVVLSVATTSPVESMDLAWPSTPIAKEIKFDGKSVTVEAEISGPIVLTPRRDKHGLDGRPDSRVLSVKADSAPTLVVKGPASSIESNAEDVLQLGVGARDDYSVASAELHYEVRRATPSASGGSEAGHVALSLEGMGTAEARGSASLALRSLDLKPGDAVAYRVKVTDNRPAPKGPNVTWSDARGLSIVAKAEGMMAHEDRVRREGFQSRLEEARKANAANKRETEQLRYAADTAQRDPSAWNAEKAADLAARETEARAVADKLQLLARDLEEDPTYAPLARPTRQAADVEAEAARAELEQARKAEPAKRLSELKQADARLGALQNRLDEVQRRFDVLAKLDLDRQKLRDLAAKEDALAAEAAQANADKGQLDKLDADQDEIRKMLESLVAKSPGLRASVLADQAQEAAELAKKARELAEKQRDESRKTAESKTADGAIKEIAEAQRAIEDDTRRLALEVDEPLAENQRARVNTDALRRATEPITRGDLPESVRKFEEAEESLRWLARDIEDVPGDLRALARRLARRQEALANDVAAAVGEFRQDNLDDARKAQLATRLKPLLDRQEAIAKVAAAIVPADPQKDAARNATQAVEKAVGNLKDQKPRQAEEAQNNAKRALNQLAEAIPDPNRRIEESRRKLDEAKRKEEEVARDIERALSETTPKPDKLDADARAATDLAEKIAPLAQKQEEAAKALAALDVESRSRPQRDRAAAKARELADRIKAVKDQAPPRRPDAKPAPPGGWHIVGPFAGMNTKVPFDPSKSVDFNVPVAGPDGKSFAWKVLPMNDDGRIDLFNQLSKENNVAAFGVAEIVSPTRRRAQLSIGSDDTMLIYLNGRQVFEFGGSRGFAPGQDKAEVELVEGVNRLVIRCSSGSGEWAFAVNASPPPPDGFDPELAKKLRENLTVARADALASTYRLESKSQNRMTADDLAAILAAEQKAAAETAKKPPTDDPADREKAAADRKRMATAIRNLALDKEAPALQAEAVQKAEAAANLPVDADPKAVAEATQAAADAAETLARRMAGELSTKDHAAALANAERSADPTKLAERQKAIAAELARIPANPANPANPATPAEAPKPAPAEPVAAVPADADLDIRPEQAARAAELAVRQRQLRERLQAVMADRVAPQDGLRRESTDLARQMADLRDRAKEVNAQAQYRANSATDLLGEHAPKAMDQGSGQLAQGKLDNARDSQRQAADLLERAARDAEDLAAGLKAESATEANANNAGGQVASNGLGDVQSKLRGLSKQLNKGMNADAAKAASPGMKQAADGLRAAAEAPGSGPPQAPKPGQDSGTPSTMPGAAGVAEADLAALQDLVKKKTGRQWGELPGHLRTEILQLSKGRYRDDYARLIQLYFREIAADAGKADKP